MEPKHDWVPSSRKDFVGPSSTGHKVRDAGLAKRPKSGVGLATSEFMHSFVILQSSIQPVRGHFLWKRERQMAR
jgi:hypothetical protein